jgi:uncharacterized protein (TIGR02646 family)
MFLYPKVAHKRAYAPKPVKNYRTYKPLLKREFGRLCVYCRQPDSTGPNLTFGADHYRPKSINRFASLAAAYTNLFYCCGGCNSRKKDYWPEDEATGPYVVNPCDDVMASHMRFDARTGRVDGRTVNGNHTIELLQLNVEELVEHRQRTLRWIALHDAELETLERNRVELGRKLRRGEVSQADHDLAALEIANDMRLTRDDRAALTGEAQLQPLTARHRRALLGLS